MSTPSDYSGSSSTKLTPHLFNATPSDYVHRIRGWFEGPRETPCQLHELARVPSDADALRLHPDSVGTMRQYLHAHRMALGDTLLERFVYQVFGNELLVECYFHLREIRRAEQPAGHPATSMLPIEAVLRAASQAYAMNINNNVSEREMAYVAALVYPCALLHCSHPYVERENLGFQNMESKRLARLRGELLRWPMRHLRGSHEAWANTLSAVLGLGSNDDTDPHQVARIASAVLLSTRRVMEWWKP